MSDHETILSRLAAVVEDRRAKRPPQSYTTKLFDGGTDAIAAKVREEAEELIEAARRTDQQRGDVIHEAADLVYHLLVMLAQCSVTLGDVEAELARRFGTSGLEEMASRDSL